MYWKQAVIKDLNIFGDFIPVDSRTKSQITPDKNPAKLLKPDIFVGTAGFMKAKGAIRIFQAGFTRKSVPELKDYREAPERLEISFNSIIEALMPIILV